MYLVCQTPFWVLEIISGKNRALTLGGKLQGRQMVNRQMMISAVCGTSNKAERIGLEVAAEE